MAVKLLVLEKWGIGNQQKYILDNQPEIWNSSQYCWTGLDGHEQV
jgi:hypothetical protein